MSDEEGSTRSPDPAEIKSIRHELGYSQRQMAKALGVSAAYIALLESGARVASQDITRRLARLSTAIPVGVSSSGAIPRAHDHAIDTEESGRALVDMPFTILFGPAGEERDEFVQTWIAELADSIKARLVFLDLREIRDMEALYEALLQQIPDARLSSTDLNVSDIAASPVEETLDRLEALGRLPIVLGFDQWNPRGGAVDRFVSELGLLARRVRVVAVTDATPPAIPGVSIVPASTGANKSPATPRDVSSRAPSGQGLPAKPPALPSQSRSALVEPHWDQLQADPARWLRRLMLLMDRGSDQDLSQARAELKLMVEHFPGEGLQWQLLKLGAELALRSNEYETATEYVERLLALHKSSAGAFDLAPVRVFKARALWEYGRFDGALIVLNEANPSKPEDACRVANWRARSLAALGKIGEALQAAEAGRRLADQYDLRGALAYSLTLSGQYELYRGNFVKARRHLDRALHISGEARELRVRPQILTTLAETELVDGRLDAARSRMAEALTALAVRPRRLWDAAYYSLTQARIERRSMNWDSVCSAAHVLGREAGVVSTKAPLHPVVPAMYAEAAACWMAAGYAHQASLVLGPVDWSAAEWVTLLQRDLVLIVATVDDAEDYTTRSRALISRAATGGASYLAAEIAFELAAWATTRWPRVAADLGRWTHRVAEGHGWKRLGQAAAPIAGIYEKPSERVSGKLVVNADGSRTLVAPRRRQPPARRDHLRSLPDPFEVD